MSVVLEIEKLQINEELPIEGEMTGSLDLSDGREIYKEQTGGTRNYEELENLPTLDGVKIIGNIRERDPTVPDWAKAPSKPTYRADEVGAIAEEAAITIEELQEMFESL